MNWARAGSRRLKDLQWTFNVPVTHTAGPGCSLPGGRLGDSEARNCSRAAMPRPRAAAAAGNRRGGAVSGPAARSRKHKWERGR